MSDNPDPKEFDTVVLSVSSAEREAMEQLWHTSGFIAVAQKLTILQICQCLRTVASLYEEMGAKSLLKLLPADHGKYLEKPQKDGDSESFFDS